MNHSAPANLSQLKGIITPDPIPWWPPAPGWWVLLGVMTTAIIMIVCVRVYRKRKQYRKDAHALLLALDANGLSDQDYLDAVAHIVKRTVLHAFSQQSSERQAQVAGLHGLDYQKFLAQYMPENTAALLVIGRFKTDVTCDREQVSHDVFRWIMSHRVESLP